MSFMLHPKWKEFEREYLKERLVLSAELSTVIVGVRADTIFEKITSPLIYTEPQFKEWLENYMMKTQEKPQAAKPIPPPAIKQTSTKKPVKDDYELLGWRNQAKEPCSLGEDGWTGAEIDDRYDNDVRADLKLGLKDKLMANELQPIRVDMSDTLFTVELSANGRYFLRKRVGDKDGE